MKKNSVFALAAMSLALTACDQDLKIVDGKIPSEFVGHVQALVGQYQGQIERRSNDLTVALDGDKLVVTAASDLLGHVCQSRIGNLKEISYKEKDGKVVLTGAVFALDANLCANETLGREINLSFTGTDPVAFNVSYLSHYESQRRCDWYVSPPPHGGMVERCWYETYAIYNSGRFVKN